MTRKHVARFAMAAALAAAALLPAGSARAGSVKCSGIAARLASLDAIPSGRSDEYAHAIAVQQEEFQRAEAEMRRLRCGFSVSGNAVERCASLALQKHDMEANLARLRRDSRSGPDRYSLERTRLLRLSAANGCDSEAAPQKTGTVRILYPGATDDLVPATPAGDDPNHIVLQPPLRSFDPNGSYRTMCVRTCDGYYFPISYAVTPAHFAADEAACRRRCPGTDVRLYFHRVPEEDAERMVSASDGTPYAALPHAFLYRRSGRGAAAGCTCQETADSFSGAATPSQQGYELLLPSDGTAPTVNGSIVSIPAPKPLAPAEIAAPSIPAPAKTETTGPEQQAEAKPVEETTRAQPTDRQDVRLVGPKFLPDPSKAEVLRVPGPTPGR